MRYPHRGMLVTGPAGESSLRLDEPLGHGAFGVVFKAKEAASGTLYAVKFPHVAAFGGEAEMTAFLNEVQAAQEIQHPNVVRVVHVETDATELPPYLVMDFVEGGTLRARLDHLRSSGELVGIERLQRWTDGLIEGIGAINAKMLHRDLRPDNILIDDDTPKIADFGPSKIVGAITRTRTFKGGQHMLYMAPEGWKLEINEIQIDMYAMGIVLYEIASLRYPYQLPPDLRNIDALREMHLFEHPTPLRELRPDLPISFCHVVMRLLDKRPQDRFRHWSDVEEACTKAWGSSESKSAEERRLIGALLEETGRLRESHLQQQSEAEKRMFEEEERRRLDEWQMQELMKTFTQAVSEFNEQSVVGEIRAQPAGTKWSYRLPHDAGTITVGFFWIDPSLKLKVGHVRFAALVLDTDGAGLNYLLCRTDESDLYGRWVACRVRHTIALHPHKMRARVEPFGLHVQDIHEIQVAEDAMHIYRTEFSNDIQGTFLEVALDAMRRRKNL